MKKLGVVYVFASVFSLFITSCDDNWLAREIAGSWSYSYSPKNDEGINETVHSTLSFVYDDDATDGGTFTEYLDGVVSDVEVEETDGSFYTYKYHSTIKGKYEIILGDIEMTYYVNTLKVDISSNDIIFDFDREKKTA